MEPKKTPSADLENKKGLFFEIGMIISIAVILIAFNLNNQIKQVESLGGTSIQKVEEEIVPITRQDEVKPPPPPPPPQTIEILNIVDNTTQINDDLEILNSEASAETKIEVTQIQISQTVEKEKEEEKIFVVVEEMPEFPGGELALRKYIASAIKYPTVAQENGIQGTVFVSFVVDRDGGVSNVKVVRGVDPSVDKEAIRVVSSLPKWKPGKQRSKPVRVSYSVPIHFRLD
jgi:periplasmic protein TonB